MVINAHGADLFENLAQGTAEGGFSETIEISAGTKFLEIRAFAELKATPPDWTLSVG